MKGIRGSDRNPGEFRRIQVAIGTDSRFVPPPHHLLPECLDRFEKYLNASHRYDPLVNCFLAHYQFEAIHPFMDGNGRVGRLLLAIMFLRHCKLSKPWLYMSEYFERNRLEYMKRLFEISTSAMWEEWIEFCLHGTIEQATSTLERCERLRVLREAYEQKIVDTGGSIRLNRIVKDLFVVPFVRVADLARVLDVSYPTAKADLDRLVEVGILTELPDVTPKAFGAKEVFTTAYGDIQDV